MHPTKFNTAVFEHFLNGMQKQLKYPKFIRRKNMAKELTLPSGKIAKIENGKGYDLLQAQIKAKTPDEIPYALIAELTEIDGLKLVYEDILQLDLEDVIVLQEEISGKLKKKAPTTLNKETNPTPSQTVNQ